MVELRDLEGFRAAFDRAPQLSRVRLIEALKAPPADLAFAAELDAFAVEIARRLRREENPAAALEVAAAGQRRTDGLRMEEALAAFALGRDAICAAIADTDPAVAAAITPLLRAARGEVPETGRASPGGAGPPPALRALHTAAQAVGWVVRGEPAKAQRVLARIDRQLQAQALAHELRAAGALAGPALAVGSLKTLMTSPLVHRRPDLRQTLVGEVAARKAPPELEALRQGLPREPLVERLALGEALREAHGPGMAAEVVRRAGAMAFDGPERATAFVYEGFALVTHSPAEAARAFDRAIELGGDLTEALRGKLLAAQKMMGTSPPGSSARKRAAREVATTAERLARALQREPQSKPLAAAAEALAARYWLRAEDSRAALCAVQKARALGSGALLAELELTEVRALAQAGPAEAHARLDALLATNPARVEAWQLKIDLANRQGDSKAAAQALLAAAEATKDPELVAKARSLSASQLKLAPFEGLVSSAASAGGLVRELSRVMFDEGDQGHGPLEKVAPYRAALAPAGRLAFDAAAIIFALLKDPEAEAVERIREAVVAWQHAPGDLARLLASVLYVHVHLGGALPVILRTLEGNVPALVALTEIFIAAGIGSEAAKVLPHFASALPRSELSRLQRLVKEAKGRVVALPGVPNPEQALREIDRALAPAFNLVTFIREQSEEDLAIAAVDDSDLLDTGAPLPPGAEEILNDLFNKIEETARLAPARAEELERKLTKILSKGPSPQAIVELVAILDELGVSPAALLDLRRPMSRRTFEPPRKMR